MIPTVKIAFDLSLAGASDFFIIGSTPIGGTATPDSAPLAGDVFTDVSDYVRSVSVRRGRSRFTDNFDAGQATIVLDNRARLFDPSAGTAVTPYGPSMLPRKGVTIDVGGQLIFTGQVEDFNLDHALGGDSTTTVVAVDGVSLLAGQFVTPGTATAQATGARIGAVLSEAAVDWPLERRSIDTGAATLGADVVADRVDVLAYLRKVSISEPGRLFMNRAGQVEFRDRLSAQTPTGVTFTDDGTGVPFQSISRESGSESLYTQVAVTYVTFPGGTATMGTAVADATSAQVDYGIRKLPIDSLLPDSGDAQEYADFLSGMYSRPTDRITGLSVNVDALSAEDKGAVLNRELGDVIGVTFTPNGIGSAIEQYAVVESIEHSVTPQQHTVSFNLSAVPNVFIIGLTPIGEGVVGF